MSEITFLGLGLMGASLARALARHGVDLTVWNRSPAKLEPFAKAGVRGESDLGAAIAASPVIVICIDNYSVTRALLEGPGIAALLPGRIVVQLSTGTPKEAVEMAAYLADKKVGYLDGAILDGPAEIDADGGDILICGDPEAQARAGGQLAKLAGKVRYLGANVAAAAVLDLAWLNFYYGSFVSIAHSAKMCRAEGVDMAAFASLFSALPFVQVQAALIGEDRFDQPTATLEVWKNALARVQQQAVDAGISSAIPDFYAQFFKKALDAGLGQQEAIAIYKVL